jgi:tRNA acetyltransferase TAN1
LDVQFYEDLVDGKGFADKSKIIPDKPLNKKIKFDDSDSSDDEDADHSVKETNNGNDAEKGEAKSSEKQQEVLGNSEITSKDDEEQVKNADGSAPKKQRVEDAPVEPADKPTEAIEEPKESIDKPAETSDIPKESTEKSAETSDKPKESTDKPKESIGLPKASKDIPIDDLIDQDLKQLGDRKKVCLLFELSYSLRYVEGGLFFFFESQKVVCSVR